jgi:hypothetical protein
VEIQAREKNDAERAKRDREEEEARQKKEIADKVCRSLYKIIFSFLFLLGNKNNQTEKK